MPSDKAKSQARKSTAKPQSVPTFRKPKRYSELPSPTPPLLNPSTSSTVYCTSPPYPCTAPTVLGEVGILNRREPTKRIVVRHPPTPPRTSARLDNNSAVTYKSSDQQPGTNNSVLFPLPDLKWNFTAKPSNYDLFGSSDKSSVASLEDCFPNTSDRN
jgi:hypothetical protein